MNVLLTLFLRSSFLSEPPDPPFLSCCSLSRCFFDFRFFFFCFGSGGGFISGSDSESESLELQKEQNMINYFGEEEWNKKIKISMNRKSTHIINLKSFLNNYLIIDGNVFIVIIKK